MDSEQIINETFINVEKGIRNILDLHHINHSIGTSEHAQIDRILTDLLSNLENLRVSTREEFVEHLKAGIKSPQNKG
jgi:hypothetical protein